MNEMLEEIKEKKQIARSASKRKGRGGSRVHLPSDNLTEGQRKKLNGPIKTYNINEPMSWATFKDMPEDLQQVYYDKLQEAWKKHRSVMLPQPVGAERCVCCGGIVPEGRMVCHGCERRALDD